MAFNSRPSGTDWHRGRGGQGRKGRGGEGRGGQIEWGGSTRRPPFEPTDAMQRPPCAPSSPTALRCLGPPPVAAPASRKSPRRPISVRPIPSGLSTGDRPPSSASGDNSRTPRKTVVLRVPSSRSRSRGSSGRCVGSRASEGFGGLGV
ncbi:hypothetical protein MPTK1_2g06250 [Marchantia polymorpha subsp. ruderalis]|uniref:Uncharacterized protein n=1 Tax=Marchantia polymorpha TaxID=3197 RepID=A0A2R6XDN7_MARPO|nr:hypothetical protein MARPO_0021s0080 [Marchantia polymorpha]BBN01297.1 hypothetical protein Mp_2g06250 [Marchantia polymorpha subsp. ruderalis]|eukprot:PTQ44221.1 hypothetical protein MARPO_0021s0080 [Marchantia polymorpha]